jgi:hypothetical protein
VDNKGGPNEVQIMVDPTKTVWMDFILSICNQNCHIGRLEELDILNGQDGQIDMSICSLTIEHIGHILKTFFDNTSNIIECTQIYLNIFLLDRHEAYGTNKLDGWSGWTPSSMNNLVCNAT